MCIFLLAAGLSLLKDYGSEGSQIGPVVLFVYLFTICYSLGEGPVAFQYSAEVFPTIQREQGMAWAVCINNTFGESSQQISLKQNKRTDKTSCSWYPQFDLSSDEHRHDWNWCVRLLRRIEPHRLGHDLLFRQRNQAAHAGRNRP
jgi:hypothetical protein